MRLATYFLSVILLSACQKATLGNSYTWLDANRVSALEKPERVLQQTRTPLKYADGSQAKTCHEYSDKSSPIQETTQNFMIRSEYLVCDSLKLTKQFPIGPVHTIPGLGKGLCEQLDLSSFPNSFGPSLQEGPATLKGLNPKAVKAKEASCLFSDSDVSFGVYGVLHVIGPKKHEYLWAEVSDEIKTGSYRSYNGLWFERESDNTLWKASKGPNLQQ